MALEKLKAIKQKIQDRVACKELYSVLTDSKEIELFNDCVSSIKNDGIGEEESNLLKDIYVGLNSIFIDISTDWDSNRGSLSSEEISIHCQNLGSILEIVTIIKGLKTGWGRAYVIPGLDEPQLIRDVESLQNTMKEVLEKMQQQQLPQSATNQGNDVNEYPDDANENEYSKLEEEAKTKFSKCIENGTIDGVSIGRYEDGDLCAIIKLQDNNNENASIKISEFLNSKFCTENNIAGFSILNGSQREVIKGHIDDKRVRYYDLGTTVQYGIKFNWYVGERECSITLSANSDGSIKIVGDKPADEDLEKNKDVKIKINDKYLSLADAVVSSKLSQPVVSQGVCREQINYTNI